MHCHLLHTILGLIWLVEVHILGFFFLSLAGSITCFYSLCLVQCGRHVFLTSNPMLSWPPQEKLFWSWAPSSATVCCYWIPFLKKIIIILEHGINLVQEKWKATERRVSFAWETPVDHNPVNSLVSMLANAAFMSNGNNSWLTVVRLYVSFNFGFLVVTHISKWSELLKVFFIPNQTTLMKCGDHIMQSLQDAKAKTAIPRDFCPTLQICPVPTTLLQILLFKTDQICMQHIDSLSVNHETIATRAWGLCPGGKSHKHSNRANCYHCTANVIQLFLTVQHQSWAVLVLVWD